MFLRLLQITVGTAESFDVPPTESEWAALLHEAERQTLCGVIYGSLNRLPASQRPPKGILLKWHSQAESIEYRSRRLDYYSSWVTERFLKAGFRSVILKGQGNARLYPSPALRVSGDVDVWLDGERQAILDYVLRFFPNQRVQWHEVEFPVRKEVTIEVHTTPSVLFCPTDNRRLQRFYDAHREAMMTHQIDLPDGPVCIPTTEVNLVFQLTHIYRHLFYEGIGLRQLMDYYYLLSSPEAGAVLPEVQRTVRSIHLTRFCEAVMWVLGEVFALPAERMILPPNEREGRFLLSEVMRAGNFGLFDSRNAFKAGAWGNFWQITRRNLRFLRSYPREVLWNPPYRIAQFIWRKRRGYR